MARTQNITTFMQLRHQYGETSCRTEIMLRHRAPFSAMQHYAFVKIALSLSLPAPNKFKAEDQSCTLFGPK